MLPTAIHEEPKEALNRRLESIGWGLFLIIIGALWLIPDERVPEGTWLIAAGVIMLGVNVVRYLNAIKLSGASMLLGLLAVIFGVGEFVPYHRITMAIVVIVGIIAITGTPMFPIVVAG